LQLSWLSFAKWKWTTVYIVVGIVSFSVFVAELSDIDMPASVSINFECFTMGAMSSTMITIVDDDLLEGAEMIELSLGESSDVPEAFALGNPLRITLNDQGKALFMLHLYTI
jgi:hypothetical protein